MENKVLPIRFSLKNGLRVIFIPMPGIKSVTVSIEGKAGAYAEKENETGLAHFTEHMVFNGTQKFPKQDELEDYITCLGGYSNAHTSYSSVSYYTRLHRDHFEDACNYISQIVIHPIFTEEAITKEKRIISEEINDHHNEKYYNFMRAEKDFLFNAGQRVNEDIAGEISDIEKIDLEKLTNFYKRNYVTENFVLGIVGDLDTNSVKDLVEKYFGDMVSSTGNIYSKNILNENDKLFIYNEDNFYQSEVCSYYPGFIYTDLDNRVPARVLASVMGGGLYSRLTSVIREKYGLVYGISATHESSADYGFFKITFSCNENNIDEVLRLQNIEIEKIKNELITDKEYLRQINIAINQHSFIYEDSVELLNVYSLLTIRGLDNLLIEDLLAKIKATTPETIKQMANKVFASKPKISIATKNAIKLQHI